MAFWFLLLYKMSNHTQLQHLFLIETLACKLGPSGNFTFFNHMTSSPTLLFNIILEHLSVTNQQVSSVFFKNISLYLIYFVCFVSAYIILVQKADAPSGCDLLTSDANKLLG